VVAGDAHLFDHEPYYLLTLLEAEVIKFSLSKPFKAKLADRACATPIIGRESTFGDRDMDLKGKVALLTG
jgi:hypothetical protein